MRKVLSSIYLIVILLFFYGFDFSTHSIPLNEIYSGGPAKDGIPALFDPKFVTAHQAKYLNDQDLILGLSLKGEVKAYPLKILNWHELVNDQVGGVPVLVSYCPLCGTGMAFDSYINQKRFLFGVSGKLYNSDVLFYDKQTESSWSQIKMEAVTGEMTGSKLKTIPLVHTSWGAWKKKFPHSKVLSKKTGYFRNYSKNPYRSYAKSEELMFPVNHFDKRLERKAWVIGVIVNGQAKAYSLALLRSQNETIHDNVGGQSISVIYDEVLDTFVIKDSHQRTIPSVQSYWFAWAAFYPETLLSK